MEDRVFEFIRLKDLKTLIFSKDSTSQKNAINHILQVLESCDVTSKEVLVDKLLKADLAEIMCESLATLDYEVIGLIFKCFDVLLRSDLFFNDQHCVYVFESLLRTLYTLTQMNDATKVLLCGIQLLINLNVRISMCDIKFSSVGNLQQIFSLLEILIDKSDHTFVLKCLELVISLLIGFDTECLDQSFCTAISKSFHNLENISFESNIIVLCQVVKMVMIRQISCDHPMYEVSKEMRQFVERQVVPFLTEVNVFGQAITEKNLQNGHLLQQNMDILFADKTLLLNLLQSILSVFQQPDPKSNEQFSHFLLSKGLLSLLPSIEQITMDDEVLSVTRSITHQVLSILSALLLGEVTWKNILEDGLKHLPPNLKEWSPILISGDYKQCVAIIVFHYFYYLSTQDCNENCSFFITLCKFIQMSRTPPLGPVLKALWFTYAVSSLNCPSDVLSNVSLKKLIQWILSKELKTLYTHHPCTLEWTFSSHYIPCELRLSILSLWLEKDDTHSERELRNVVMAHPEVSLMLIKIIQESEHADRVSQLILSLFDNLPERVSEAIGNEAWAQLPKFLTEAKYSHKLGNVSGSLAVCTTFVPSEVDQSLVCRVILLLPQIFVTYLNPQDHKEDSDQKGTLLQYWIQFFYFTRRILDLTVMSEDTRGVLFLMREARFINFLEIGLKSEEPSLIMHSIHIFNSLVEAQRKLLISDVKSVEIPDKLLLESFLNKSVLVGGALRLLSSYFDLSQLQLANNIVDVTFSSTRHLRVLYAQIHTLCIKGDEAMGRLCWLCLHQLLLFSAKVDLQTHLAHSPFTQTLLQLWKPQEKVPHEMLNFLVLWVDFLPPRGSFQALKPPNMHVALAKVICNILEKFEGFDDPTMDAFLRKIVRTQVVPPHIKSSLRVRLSTKEGQCLTHQE